MILKNFIRKLFYSTYGIKYKYYKSESLNKGKFLGFDLEWKSELFKFLEKFGIKNLFQDKKFLQSKDYFLILFYFNKDLYK